MGSYAGPEIRRVNRWNCFHKSKLWLADTNLTGWLSVYAASTPGCELFNAASSVMGDHDVPQPDAALRITPESGGQSNNAGEYVGGAPELIVEVSGSITSRDLGVKLDLYRRSGVREYLTILIKPRQVIWRQLVRGRYKEVLPSEDGLIRSATFPGLWLDPESVWKPEAALRTILEGVRSPEHAAFVRRLATRRH